MFISLAGAGFSAAESQVQGEATSRPHSSEAWENMGLEHQLTLRETMSRSGK